MADDVTPAEVYRRLKDHEERTDRTHEALDGRITKVAAESVSGKVWEARESYRDDQWRALTERVQRVEAELERRDQVADADAAERLRERARDRRLVIAAFISPLILLLLQIYLTGKGG